MEYRYRELEPNYSIWWQVALGVFLAMLAHSTVTGLYAKYEMQKTLKLIEAEARKSSQQAQRQLDAIAEAKANSQSAYGSHAPQTIAPLRDGERCIQGRRFKRVENGWVQLPRDPC